MQQDTRPLMQIWTDAPAGQGGSLVEQAIDDERDQTQVPTTYSLDEVDLFGEATATVAFNRWLDVQNGPTWREVLAATEITDLWSNIAIPTNRRSLARLLFRATGRHWIARTTEARSLCAGPRFFALDGRPYRSAETVGRLVAQTIGTFRYRTHRSPCVDELAQAVRDSRGRKVFRDPADAHAQLPWLLNTGWIRFEGNDIRRGPYAKLDKRQRADKRRHASRR